MAAQRTLDEVGTPLAAVTFCIVDLETTGGSAADSAITEIGAIKVRAGVVVGSFHTLVNPGRPVPAFIRMLTGISDDDVAGAPPVEAVLPSFLEFLQDAILVAHNATFDVSFLNAALKRAAYPCLANRTLCTARLARKILAGEVPNHRLATLASHLRCSHQPSHRAYPDVLATCDVLHHLIERVAGYGVTTLEDLVAFTTARIDRTFSKIALARNVPYGPGIYRFIAADGTTLYVGKATDLRSRVRSYFYGDPRRKMRDLLREMQDVTTERHATMLEAEVAEARAIATEKPLYNRVGKRGGSWFVKLIVSSNRARLAAARVCKDDGAVYLGPFQSSVARTLLDGLRDAAPIHRCTDPRRCRGCAFAGAGRCTGRDPQRHAAILQTLAAAMLTQPRAVLEPIAERMKRLAAQERFEEAAEVRERGALLERALRRAIDVRSLIAAGDIAFAIGGRALLVRRGRLVAAVDGAGSAGIVETLLRLGRGAAECRHLEREAALISSWITKNHHRVAVLWSEKPWALPATSGPSRLFSPRPADPAPPG